MKKDCVVWEVRTNHGTGVRLTVAKSRLVAEAAARRLGEGLGVRRTYASLAYDLYPATTVSGALAKAGGQERK